MSISSAFNPVALITGGALGGEQLGILLFGKDLDLNTTNLKEKYLTQISLLDFATTEGFFDKKIYAYYIFGLILAHQSLLIKLESELNNDKYIAYYANTFPEWKAIIDEIKLDVLKTLERFLCYESLFKKIFNIKYDERDFFIIREKIIVWQNLSELQANQLHEWLIKPLFDGFFDFNAKDISVIKCLNQICTQKYKEGYGFIEECSEAGCEVSIIKDFPLPLLMAKEIQEPEYSKHNQSLPDCIRPWALYNTLTDKKKLSLDLLDSWSGVLDSIIGDFTGINKGYTIKAGKKAGELANTAIDFYADMKKEFADLRASLANAYLETKNTFGGFKDALMIGGIGLGAFLLMNLLSSDSKER